MKGRPNGNRLVPTAFVTGVLETTMELRGLRRKSCRRLYHLKPEEASCGAAYRPLRVNARHPSRYDVTTTCRLQWYPVTGSPLGD